MANPDPLKTVSLGTLLLALATIALFVALGLVLAWVRYRQRKRELEAHWRKQREQHANQPSAWEEAGRRYHGEENEEDEDDPEAR